MRRLRHLGRVYYDALLSGRKTAEFKFCDIPSINELVTVLHQCGITLQLMPARLRALFRIAGPDMDALLFDEPLDLGKWRINAFKRLDDVVKDEEYTYSDLHAAAEIQVAAEEDVAAFHTLFFIGDLLVAWATLSPMDKSEELRAKRAMERLAQLSSGREYCKYRAFVQPFTDILWPIYTEPSILVRFAHAGGLPVLFEGWVCYRF